MLVLHALGLLEAPWQEVSLTDILLLFGSQRTHVFGVGSFFGRFFAFSNLRPFLFWISISRPTSIGVCNGSTLYARRYERHRDGSIRVLGLHIGPRDIALTSQENRKSGSRGLSTVLKSRRANEVGCGNLWDAVIRLHGD